MNRLLPRLLFQLTLWPLLVVAAPFEDSMAQRLLACSACHGDQGRAGPDGFYPRLAGKPEGYLYHQLQHFRDGRRHYGLMTRLVEPLSDAYLAQIARHYAQLELPYPPPKPAAADAATLARGRTLALQGDSGRQLPACVRCHGQRLTGVAPDVPGLLGLPRDYLNAQLGGWKSGQRKAHAPDCMAEVTRALSTAELNALAHWLSSQPVPADSKPALTPPSGPGPAPDCGRASATNPGTGASSASATPGTPAAPELLQRGAYLARAGNCQACHSERGAPPWSGGRGIQTPFGTVYSGNLTPDPATGLGAWSNEDFWQALHHGRSRDGRLLYPAFPYTSYTRVTRADADALFAYLRSLPPVTRAATPHALRWPYGTQAALAAWRALYFEPAGGAAGLAEGERGAYLVQALGHCSACHTARNALGASDRSLDLGGGAIPMQNWYAPALTSPLEAGVAHWSPAEVATLLKTGVAPRGSVTGPMAEVVLHSTQYLSDADLGAMAAFLRALPQQPAAAATVAGVGSARGAKLYDQYCADCHGAQGRGVAAAYPALAGNRAVSLANPSNLVQMVLYGGFAPATTGNPRPYGMPPFALRLSDADVAAVLTHTRSAWGNRAPTVSELDVSRMRAASSPH